jgi:F0F1-type ATP synthase delta subunit
VTWLRANIHPQALVQVGLQPNIAAGCVVRTANKQFDLSLRQSFAKHKDLLIEQFRGAKV